MSGCRCARSGGGWRRAKFCSGFGRCIFERFLGVCDELSAGLSTQDRELHGLLQRGRRGLTKRRCKRRCKLSGHRTGGGTNHESEQHLLIFFVEQGHGYVFVLRSTSGPSRTCAAVHSPTISFQNRHVACDSPTSRDVCVPCVAVFDSDAREWPLQTLGSGKLTRQIALEE
jgi:hypothetical protein